MADFWSLSVVLSQPWKRGRYEIRLALADVGQGAMIEVEQVGRVIPKCVGAFVTVEVAREQELEGLVERYFDNSSPFPMVNSNFDPRQASFVRREIEVTAVVIRKDVEVDVLATQWKYTDVRLLHHVWFVAGFLFHGSFHILTSGRGTV